MSISSNLKAIRSKRGMTQGNLADKAGIELTQVSRIERGASEPKLETIKRLAIALSCSTDELIMDAEPASPEYIKRTVERIRGLTPLKRYVVLDMINSYCNQNDIPEPTLHPLKSSMEEMHEEHYNTIKALEIDMKNAEELALEVNVELQAMHQEVKQA